MNNQDFDYSQKLKPRIINDSRYQRFIWENFNFGTISSEYVLPSNVTETVGLGALEKLRQDPKGFMEDKVNISNNSGGAANNRPPSNTNVYVVSPQSVPQTVGRNDIIVAISDDIVRDGPLKTLIKQVTNE